MCMVTMISILNQAGRVMKKLFVFILAISAGLSWSCSKEDDVLAEPDAGAPQGKTVFRATTEPATKTALEKNGDTYNVVWQNGDKISVVDSDSHIGVYSTTSTTTKADFTFVSGSDATTAPYKAYYPETVYNSGTPTLPATQNYVEGNISGSPMYAESSTESLAFKNICGIIRLNVSTTLSGMKVSKIILSADQGMSGAISNAATLMTDNFVAAVTGTEGVTLDCGENGVDIGSTAVPFHISVPQNNYSSLSITVITTDNSTQKRTLKTGKTVSVQRSGITTINISFNDFIPEPVDLSKDESANSYIVSKAGYYKFKATVKGNGGLDPLTGTTATTIDPSSIAGVKVLWELYGQGRAIKHDGTNYAISYSDGYVYFFTPDTFTPGDAYVAIYDADDNILWSWLIWATPEPGRQIVGDQIFMTQNLGGIPVGNCMRGFLYEWGRKDPFPAADGNNNKPYDYVPDRMTCHAILSAGSGVTMSYTIEHPTTYVDDAAWITESDFKKNLWSITEKTIYDPCPPGWKVPSRTQMETLHYNIGLSTLPSTGFIGDCSSDFEYGNPGFGYYWSSSAVDRSKAYASCNDNRLNYSWPTQEGYAIRPVRHVVVDNMTVYDRTATSYYVPVYGTYADAYLKCEYIMPSADLMTMYGLKVKSMTFYLKSHAESAWGGTFQVFMKEVDYTSISEYSGTAGATIIYTGPLDASGSTMTINFTTPYTYKGGNLLIGVYEIAPVSYYGAVFYGQDVTGACVQGYKESSLDDVPCNQRDFLPKTTFHFQAY